MKKLLFLGLLFLIINSSFSQNLRFRNLIQSPSLDTVKILIFPANPTPGGKLVIGITPGGDSVYYFSPIYSINWTLDSTFISTYGLSTNRTWFKSGIDTLMVDSAKAVSYGRASTDTVSIRILWGVNRSSPSDSLADLKIFNSTIGLAVGGANKKIGPKSWVWIKVVEADGSAREVEFAIEVWRKL
jgi:hypothetical protein